MLADPERRARLERQVPARRIGYGRETTQSALSLAGERCGHMAAHVLPLAGGWA
jgi:hypothetical protein